MEVNKGKIVDLLKKLFNFSGRATRKDYWVTTLWLFLAQIAVCLIMWSFYSIFKEGLADVLAFPLVLVLLAIGVAGVANLFRRMHDLGLSGFWTVYLLPYVGLPCMFCAYLMDADKSATAMVERIKNVGSPWLSWILTILFWLVGSSFGVLLILLSPGQKQDNIYGPNPYEIA